jgi:hypothetical protein
LRSSLGAYCQTTGTSEEVVLDVEFLPSTLPPQLESTQPSEDWVSDVSVAVRGCVASSPCYVITEPQVTHPLFFCEIVEHSSRLLTPEPSRFNRPTCPLLPPSPSPVTTNPSSLPATFPILSARKTRDGSRVEDWTVSVAFGSTPFVFLAFL